jgi:DNA-binding NtrC family response regulator
MPVNILVADDDKAMLNLYSRIFSGKDYVIAMAESFAAAAELIRDNDYDLLVTDLMFPDGIGTELVKLFEKKRAGAKSLVVTGSAPLDGSLLKSGAAAYFEKPFKVESFMAAVENAVGA